jgi:hypothetical protein
MNPYGVVLSDLRAKRDSIQRALTQIDLLIASLEELAPSSVPEGTESVPESCSHACPHAQEFGSAGGKARAEKLSPERRQEIARTAAQARWGRK